MSKDLPRIMPVSTSTSCMFRVSLCQKIKRPNTPEKTRRKNQKKTYKKKMKEEKGKRGFIRPGLVFPVKKMTSGNGDEELCKKRILMGERCKPINRSGVLQYDGDGILVYLYKLYFVSVSIS
ncbi:hypothetical protein HID58_031937 [Brassica napus]|uniref:Uncharacterized protein n=1 Tax=Brassica napus TaxID=3708 RepID=A0ABQ8BWQ6_BRANA|nr:hypothetical protein HID58_031937 [Brassica napus]